MVAMGGAVVFAGRSEAKLAEALTAAGGVSGVIADIAEPEDCERLIAESVDHLGGTIALLLIVVGVSKLGLVKDAGAELWRQCLLTNVMGPALVTRAAIPHLTPNTFVGYFSSESVGMPYHGLVPYGTSKAALEEMARGVRAGHLEFRISCLRVGATSDTEFARDFDGELAAQLTQKWVERGQHPDEPHDRPRAGEGDRAHLRARPRVRRDRLSGARPARHRRSLLWRDRVPDAAIGGNGRGGAPLRRLTDPV